MPCDVQLSLLSIDLFDWETFSFKYFREMQKCTSIGQNIYADPRKGHIPKDSNYQSHTIKRYYEKCKEETNAKT